MRTAFIALLLGACASAPTVRAPARPAPQGQTSPSPAAGPVEPCGPMPDECGETVDWLACDDCDTDQLVTLHRPAVLVACLERALRCGPEGLRARSADRAVLGLVSLAPLGTASLVRSRAWRVPPSAAARIDRELGGPSGLAPPAGLAPCRPSNPAASPEEAALECFRSRVRPAILALNDRDAHYYFGRGDYRVSTYQLAPVVRLAPSDWVSVQRNLALMPQMRLVQATALGGVRSVTPERSWVVVEVLLRSDDMPADGDAALLFVLDRETRETAFVFVRRH